MPERKTKQRANRAKRQGKAATTQAGEYVLEEMHHMKKKKHPVKNRKQAVAIGLSKARKAGVKVPKKKSSSRKKSGSSTTRGRSTRSSKSKSKS